MIAVVVHTSGVNWQATSVIISGVALVIAAAIAPVARWQAGVAAKRRAELARRLDDLAEGQSELLQRTARIEGHLGMPQSREYARRAL